MNALQAQKRLLLAESELNRRRLAEDLHDLAGEARSLGGNAGLIASCAAALLGGRSAAADGPPRSWPQIALSGAGLLASLWTRFRSR